MSGQDQYECRRSLDNENSSEKDVADLARGALVNFVGKVGRSSRGAFIWLITFFFGLDILGLYSLSWGWVSTANRVSCLGLGRGVIHFVVSSNTGKISHSTHQVIATALGMSLTAGLIVAVFNFFIADTVSQLYDKPIAEAIKIMAWTSPFMSMTVVLIAATQALRIMRFDVYVHSVGGPLILLLGVTTTGILGYNGMMSVSFVQFIMGPAMLALATIYFTRCYSFSGLLNLNWYCLPWKRVFRFSFPVMVTDLLYGLLTQLDVLVMGFFVSLSDIGIYSLARRIAGIMLKASQAFDPIFSPVISQLSAQGRQKDLINRFVVISRWNLLINLPIFFTLLILSDQISLYMTGVEILNSDVAVWTSGLQVLILLCIGTMLQGVFAIVEPLLAMSGKPKLNMFNNTIWLISNLILDIWLVRYWGIVGVAIGSVLSTILVNVIRSLEVYYYHGVSIFDRSQLKPLLSAFIAVFVAWVASYSITSVLGRSVTFIFLFLFIYMAILSILGLEKEEKSMIRNLIKRYR